MPTLLRQRPCPKCGRPHNFCLATRTVAAGETYEYVCPETGKRGHFRADAGGETSVVYPQGAVALEAPSRAA